MEARGSNGGDGHNGGLARVGSGLANDGRGLVGLRGRGGGLASDDTERVGLGEETGLGEGVHRGGLWQEG